MEGSFLSTYCVLGESGGAVRHSPKWGMVVKTAWVGATRSDPGGSPGRLRQAHTVGRKGLGLIPGEAGVAGAGA